MNCPNREIGFALLRFTSRPTNQLPLDLSIGGDHVTYPDPSDNIESSWRWVSQALVILLLSIRKPKNFQERPEPGETLIFTPLRKSSPGLNATKNLGVAMCGSKLRPLALRSVLPYLSKCQYAEGTWPIWI